MIVLGEDMRNRILAKGVRAERIEIVRDGTEILPHRLRPSRSSIPK